MGGQKRVKQNRNKSSAKVCEGFHNWVTKQQKRYKDYVGIDPFDTTCQLFTEEQQVERYAKNVAFWVTERQLLGELDTDSVEPVKYQKLCVVDSGYTKILDRVKDSFDEDVQKRIFKRVSELLS